MRVEIDGRSPAQHRTRELVLLIGGKRHVVETDHEQRGVDQLEIAPVGAVVRMEQIVPDVGPHPARLCGEHAKGRGSASGGFRVHDDRVEVPLQLFWGGEDGLVACVQHVEPVELATIHRHHVMRRGVCLQVARGLAGTRRDSTGAE